MLKASKIELLKEFEGQQGNFVKTFLLNSEINFNGWMATKEANKKNAQDFRGMPMILWWNEERKLWDHPEYNSKDEAIEKQEEFRVGTILKVGFDKRTNNWWQVSVIHNNDLWKKIQSHEIKYVSPSVWPKKLVEGMSNPLITTDYWALHVAFVTEPAFGIATGNVKGFCEGDPKKCLAELGPMVASIENNIDHIRTVPFIKSKSSLIPSRAKSNSNMTDDKTVEEMKKQLDSLKAQFEEEIKKKDQQSGNEDHEDDKSSKQAVKGQQESENKKEDEKQHSGNEETEEQKKEKQQSAAVIQLAKKPIITKILTASKKNGANDATIKAQEKFMMSASLPELQNYEIMMTPFIQNPSIPQESSLWPNIDQTGNSLDASVHDVDISDNDILEAI